MEHYIFFLDQPTIQFMLKVFVYLQKRQSFPLSDSSTTTCKFRSQLFIWLWVKKINPQPALLGTDPTHDEKSLLTATVFTIIPTFTLRRHFPHTSFCTYRRKELRSLPLMSVAQSLELTSFYAIQCNSLYFHRSTDIYLCSTLCDCKKGLQSLPLSHYRRYLPHDSQGHPTPAKYWFRNRIFEQDCYSSSSKSLHMILECYCLSPKV